MPVLLKSYILPVALCKIICYLAVIAEVAKRNALLGSPAELFFWRTRAQSEVDLVVKLGEKLRGFEIKWSPRWIAGRAFRGAYGVEVEPVFPDDPFAVDISRV